MTTPVPFLGVGPVSRNVVDAAIVAAYRCRRHIMLIPSRRQVDAAEFGGGYLGWTTEQFAAYVRARDPDRRVLLCRDHGGPWQHPAEDSIGTETEVLDSCVRSFESDAAAGFELLHVDTSREYGRTASIADASRRLVHLYARCLDVTAAVGRRLLFEIGFEPQDVDTNDPDEFEAALCHVLDPLAAMGAPPPLFVVAQTGTKVVELANAGSFTDAGRVDETLREVRKLAGVCHRRGVLLKAHNCDYLAPEGVAALAAAGVDALNVAPEFGVAETRAVLRLMSELQLTGVRDRFLELAYASGKWDRWMAHGTSATDFERAVIAGHYVFETETGRELRDEVRAAQRRRGRPELDAILQAELSLLIERYLTSLSVDWYQVEPDLATASQST